MNPKPPDPPESEKDLSSSERRDFLRRSIYAAYTTPLVVSLLVEKAGAAQSWNPGQGNQPDNESWHRYKYRKLKQDE